MKHRKILTAGIIVCILILLLYKFFDFRLNRRTVFINGRKIYAEIADTKAKREKGLSGRKSLADDRGMFFVFPSPGIHPFWMKDMNFPLDFVWIAQMKVVDLSENVPVFDRSSGKIKTVTPVSPVDSVLEVNAGSIKKWNLKPGARILL